MIGDLFLNIKNSKKRIFLVIDILTALLYLFVMAYSFSRPLRDFVNVVTGNSIIVITIYFFIFYVLYFVISFPSKYYQALEQIKTQGFKDWFDVLSKKETTVFFVMFFAIQFVYFFLEGDVVWWWIPVSVLCFVSRVIVEFGAKYATAYYLKIEPMDESEGKQRLIEICSRSGLKVKDVFYQQGLKAQAIVLGTDPQKRLILNKDLIDYAQEEKEIIVSRETVCHRLGFLRKKLLVEAMVIFCSFLILNVFLRPVSEFFGFEFIFDIETLPVVIGLFFVAFLIMALVRRYIFRKIEREIETSVLKSTQSPDAFISLLIRRKEKETEQGPDSFLNQLLKGGLSELEKMSLAQDYAQALVSKHKVQQKLQQKNKEIKK